MSGPVFVSIRSMYYIGIGASAGGQAALCEFFDHLPPGLAAAFFITTHLSRQHRSQLDEILQRHTVMSVLRVTYWMKIQSNVVYVQPEYAALQFDRQYIFLLKRLESEKINRCINTTLESLALTFGHQAIGIILSGTGEDGTNGILKISANGGKVLIQDPHTTLFTGMPTSAIINDHPIAISSPADLARRIAEIVTGSVTKKHS